MKKISMKRVFATLFLASFCFILWPVSNLRAEDKPPAGRTFPKLPKTPDDPILSESHVYPFWGPTCQRYTYSVIYQDKEGRPPEYVRIYFNGDWIDIEKENPEDNDYKRGVKYIYKFVPKKIGSNFYFFEASNGLGKARDGIIDSPDNGPVLFESAFDKNEIALIDAATGEKVWSFPTEKEWVGGAALSDDGKYLAAQTSHHIHFFETSRGEPKWSYRPETVGTVGGDVKGGIAISADGSEIFALLGNRATLFDRGSNEPLWEADTGNGGYNAAISANGEYLAVATAGMEEDENTNLLILWRKDSSKRLWQYHSSGNFHDVSFSADGSLIAAATGCPDRRGYLFSKDSNEPVWRSEMLTRDSPIHRAKISADGSLAAFGAESDGGAVHLFSKDANQMLWKFPAPGNSSFRALSITPSGQFIGGATLGGRAFILDKSSPTPLVSWTIDGAFGAVDIANDGSFIAAGGTDSKVHIFERESKKERAAVALGEYIGEIDISGDGRYIAAGTSGSVYFFESLDRAGSEVECAEIIEPPSERETMTAKQTYCGDGVCVDPPEDATSCPQDCDPNYAGLRGEGELEEEKKGLPPRLIWVFGGGFLASLLGLGGYLAIVKFKFFRKPPPASEEDYPTPLKP